MPKPVPVKTATPLPPSVAKPFAPEGTYFLLQRIAIATRSGNIAIPAGTQVRLIRKEGNFLRVTDGTHEFQVLQQLLTDDLDVASGIVVAAGAHRADAATPTPEPPQRKQMQAKAVQTPRKATTPRPTSAPTASKTPTVSQGLQAQYDQLDREEISVNAQLADAQQAWKEADYAKWRYRNYTGKKVSPGEIKGLKARLKQIQQAKRQVQLQLGAQPQ